MEEVREFGVKDIGCEVIGDKEGSEGYVVSALGFKEDSCRGEGLECGEVVLVAINGLREVFDKERFRILIDNTAGKVILGNINVT